jgi:hypothetical protein
MNKKSNAPRYGMKKIANSHAIAEPGRRFLGMTMSATIRMTRSTASAVIVSQKDQEYAISVGIMPIP